MTFGARNSATAKPKGAGGDTLSEAGGLYGQGRNGNLLWLV